MNLAHLTAIGIHKIEVTEPVLLSLNECVFERYPEEHKIKLKYKHNVI